MEYLITIFERAGKRREIILESADMAYLQQDLSERKGKYFDNSDYGKYRYFDLRDLAWRTLLKSNAHKLPIELEQIAFAHDIVLLSYQKDKAFIDKIDKHGILRASREGFSLTIMGNDIVCYNEIENNRRRRFTIAHEIGHLLLQHSRVKIDNYESEASMFARRILAPSILLYACDMQSAEETAQLCDISLQAADIAFKRYQNLIGRSKFLSNDLERQVLEKFSDFVEVYNHNKG